MVVPYKNQNKGKKEQVADMFNSISHKYDFLNHLLSGGIDIIWRRKAIKLLKNKGIKKVLDIATGTGDFAIEALKINPDKIVGVDISEGMLAFGKEKIKKMGLEDKITLQMGDSEKLPFSDNSFDAITVSFGVRNYETLDKGLKDMFRVLKPGGYCLILEFSNPRHFPKLGTCRATAATLCWHRMPTTRCLAAQGPSSRTCGTGPKPSRGSSKLAAQ